MILQPTVDAPTMNTITKSLSLSVLFIAACVSPESSLQVIPAHPEPVGTSSEPEMAPINWKECLPVLYIYDDCLGDYRQKERALIGLKTKLASAGIQAAGPAFALFYDDPGNTPIEELNYRVCVPVTNVPPSGDHTYAVMPQVRVAYTTVRGSHQSLPNVYPTLLAYLAKHNWKVAGPIREIYLDGHEPTPFNGQPLSEIQVAWQ